MNTTIKYVLIGMSRGEDNIQYIGGNMLNMSPRDDIEERLLASISLIRRHDYILTAEELNFIFDYLRLKERGSVRVIEIVRVEGLEVLSRQLSVNIKDRQAIFKVLK